MLSTLDSRCQQFKACGIYTNTNTLPMGVIYKILRQQRQQEQGISMDLSTATKCKVQAAIKQRQLQQHKDNPKEQQQQRQQYEQQQQEDTLAEQQLQQLCCFLAENAARKKRQRLKQYQYRDAVLAEQPLGELPALLQPHATNTHDMDMLMEQLSSCTESSSTTAVTATATATATRTSRSRLPSTGAPRDSILLKIRHQIFERKRQRQRQLVEHRLVVWRPW